MAIGTQTAKGTLDVYTPLPSLGTYESQYWSTDNPGYSLKLRNTWSNTYGITQEFIQRSAGTDYPVLSFFSGKVGIGTSTAAARFEVNYNLPGQGTHDIQQWSVGNTAYTMRLQAVWNNNGIAHKFVQRFNNTDYPLLYFYSGNVGIGTPGAPAARLDVNFDLPAPGVYDVQQWSVGNPSHNLRVQAYWDNTSGISERIVQRFNGADYPVLSFYSGNVGIGVSKPGDIDAKLAVRGTIHAQEVLVDLSGAVAPDYVFEQTYALPTLAETEQYIKDNKHLPEIPSASQLEKNGIKVMEMNLLLLKKIEEMTLHLIQQEKMIQEQNKRISELESFIKK
ncbi:hypothetical protein D4L85_34180 [Chryseolinea soli]|uniref:Uncharacterized protein n=1 Tax=Chryseolinea soli TaxID=2321403 RepID=A0A385SXF7_9BACT|nr:hypothetical protein D4L85_34180 [Chryseolinea soli]